MSQSTTSDVDKKRKALQSFTNTVNDKYKAKNPGKPLVLTGEALMEELRPKYISTGIPHLDDALGGGWPRGCVSSVYGPGGTGKTALAAMFAAEVQKEGGAVFWISTEGDPPYHLFELYGVDPTLVAAINGADFAEQSIDVISQSLKEHEKNGLVFDGFVIDSITAMTPKSQIDKREKDGIAEDNQPGRLANLTSKWFADLVGRNLLRGEMAMLVVSQERVDINTHAAHGVPTKQTGGKAMEHYPKVVLKVSRGAPLKEKIDGSDVRVGHVIRWVVEKNNVNSRYFPGEYGVIYGVGVDDSSGVVEKAMQKELIVKAGRKDYVVKLPTGEVTIEGGIGEVRERFKFDTELKNQVKELLRKGSKAAVAVDPPAEQP